MKDITGRRIFSIGHSNRTLVELVSILKHYSVEALADIRSYPRSKRNTHFDREPLERELPATGVEYVWIKELGGMRGGGYEEHMNTPEFEAGLNALIALASGKKTAFMCAELDWRRCHRAFVSQALHSRGWHVVHIYDGRESETHSGLF
ncbi:MAG TPA: DUF488 domain-containing protein [Thermodesulfobacteriota bacterium]|nr:DUF488 domain-containing protein [Thermodesulfobacteriota bacterium]